MKKKTNKYVKLFVIANLLFVLIYVVFNWDTINKISKINEKKDFIRSNEMIVLEINKNIYSLENEIFKLTVFGINNTIIKYYIEEIDKRISYIKRLVSFLQKGGEFTQNFMVNATATNNVIRKIKVNKEFFDVGLLDVISKLNIIENNLKSILKKIEIRNKKFDKKNMISLKRELKLLPSLFKRMMENTNRYLIKTDKMLKDLEKNKNDLIKKYLILQAVFLFLFISFNILTLLYLTKSFHNLYKELQYRLYYDNLTKLKNRMALEEDLKNPEFKHLKKSLVFVDINGFNNINELYGVEVGNEYLVNFATLLQNMLKDKNVYRIGSDEFAVLYFEETEIKGVSQELYKRLVNEKIYIESLDIDIDIGVKIGIAEGENLLKNATYALQLAKEKNKPVYKVTDKDFLEVNKKIKESMFWSRKIKDALKNDRFVPFFQPIVDQNGNIVKYEVLMRMKDGDKFIPPIFLDIAVKNMQYVNISETLFKKIVSVLKDKDIKLSFNVNFLDIENLEMRNLILKTLSQNPDIAKRLTFEILENLEIQEYKLIEDFINELKKLGSTFAIDDFGSGFSNYKRVLDLNTDFLKIDGSLIKNIHEDNHSYNIVKSIALFAKESNIKTVAEFVHCKKVFEVCKELGIDYFQGYYFSPPVENI